MSTFSLTGTKPGNSHVQQKAERIIRERLAETFGISLEPQRVELSGGGTVQVDATAGDDTLFAEIFARQGKLKAGQQKKVAIDAFKLITIQRDHPDARLVLAFADEIAADYARGEGWLAHSLRAWGVQVLVVDIPAELHAEIQSAQTTQLMVSADEIADDIVVPETADTV